VPRERPAAVKAHVGSRIAEIRRAKGISQEALATKLDVTTQWFSRVENGHENLTIETLVRVANAIGVRVVELFQEGDSNADLAERTERKPMRKQRSR
jgi:transcriptional regulator with XRE-family HTH domain